MNPLPSSVRSLKIISIDCGLMSLQLPVALDNPKASRALFSSVAFKSEQDHIKLVTLMGVRLTFGMFLWSEI